MYYDFLYAALADKILPFLIDDPHLQGRKQSSRWGGGGGGGGGWRGIWGGGGGGGGVGGVLRIIKKDFSFFSIKTYVVTPH